MPILTTVALGILVSLASTGAMLQQSSQPAGQAVRSAGARLDAGEHAVRTRLSTVVDHVDLLAGRLVQLPPSRVTRVLSPTLAELRDPRQRGIHRLYWARDHVLVVLPAGTQVSEGDEIILEGWVRTVGGAVRTGELTGADEDLREDRRNEPLLVAARVATVDGVSLTGSR